jgi:hypothetical protein
MSMSTTATAVGPAAAQTETWEYTYLNVKIGAFSTEIQTMNAAGAEGWELVSSTPLHMGNGFKDAALTSSVLLLFKRRRR